MRQYIMNILRAADILLNTIGGGKVRTISARLGHKKAEGRMNWFDRCLDWGLELIDPGHCLDSYEAWRPMVDRNGQTYEIRKSKLMCYRRFEE
jgi:hypothetical protein